MGEHVHEHVGLEVDSEQVGAGPGMSDEQKFKALIEALASEETEIEVTTTTEESE